MSLALPDLENYRGKWVAYDQHREVVVEAADTHEALLLSLARRPGRKVIIHRVPALDEPIFVGLG